MVDRIPKIKIDPRTGMPSISRYLSVGAREARRNKKQGLPSEGASSDVSSPSGTSSSPKGQEASAEKELDEEDLIEEEEYDSDQTERGDRVTIARDRNESAEDKRARKAAAKELKQVSLACSPAPAFADNHTLVLFASEFSLCFILARPS